MKRKDHSAPDLRKAVPLVRAIAWGLAPTIPHHIHMDDLFGEGFLGLVEALNRFDPDRGVLFTTFAYPWVRGRMLDFVRSECRHARHVCLSPRSSDQGSASGPEAAVLHAQQRGRLGKAVETLPARRRMLMEALLDGVSTRQAADRVALSLANAYKLRRLAIKTLQTQLAEAA